MAFATVAGPPNAASSEAGSVSADANGRRDAATVFDDAGAQPGAISGTLAVGRNVALTVRSPDGAEPGATGLIVWPNGFRQDDDHVVTDTGARIGAGDSDGCDWAPSSRWRIFPTAAATLPRLARQSRNSARSRLVVKTSPIAIITT